MKRKLWCSNDLKPALRQYQALADRAETLAVISSHPVEFFGPPPRGVIVQMKFLKYHCGHTSAHTHSLIALYYCVWVDAVWCLPWVYCMCVRVHVYEYKVKSEYMNIFSKNYISWLLHSISWFNLNFLCTAASRHSSGLKHWLSTHGKCWREFNRRGKSMCLCVFMCVLYVEYTTRLLAVRCMRCAQSAK